MPSLLFDLVTNVVAVALVVALAFVVRIPNTQTIIQSLANAYFKRSYLVVVLWHTELSI